jgi:hypothetical protein
MESEVLSEKEVQVEKNLVKENQFAKIWLGTDEIMHCTFAVDLVNADIAKSCVSVRLAAAKGRSYCTIIDARRVNSITKEAREYLASDAGSKDISASALLINSHVGKIMSNFFLVINKPKIPVKVFTNEADAIAWLQKYR